MAMKSQQSDILVGDALLVPTAHAVIAGGIVTSYVVDTNGDGYSVAPTVIVTPYQGGAGSGATGTAVLTGKKVTSITLGSGGTLYAAPPVISFGPESDATTLENALKPVDGYVDPITTADQVRAVFIHVAAGGVHH